MPALGCVGGAGQCDAVGFGLAAQPRSQASHQLLPSASARMWSNVRNFGRTRAMASVHFEPTLAAIRPSSPQIQVQADLAEIGPFRSNSSQVWPNSVLNWPHSRANIGPVRTEFVRLRAEFGRPGRHRNSSRPHWLTTRFSAMQNSTWKYVLSAIIGISRVTCRGATASARACIAFCSANFAAPSCLKPPRGRVGRRHGVSHTSARAAPGAGMAAQRRSSAKGRGSPQVVAWSVECHVRSSPAQSCLGASRGSALGAGKGSRKTGPTSQGGFARDLADPPASH